jgi:hypothetical protein
MMTHFKPGRAYKFKSPHKLRDTGWRRKGRTHTERLYFVRTVQGNGVYLHLFKSEIGGYYESFTDWQLKDFSIEEVA